MLLAIKIVVLLISIIGVLAVGWGFMTHGDSTKYPKELGDKRSEALTAIIVGGVAAGISMLVLSYIKDF